jgi:succinate-semialdehyde dehydrogenase/glutarate-semialdehyde dehydrogenase
MTSNTSQCFINGSWCFANSQASFTVTNPATDERLADVPSLTPEQVDDAIHAANEAFAAWKQLPARQRSHCIRTIGELLLAKQEECARLITSEQGKPLKEARGEVLYAANYLLWFAEEALRVYGDIIPSDSISRRIFVLKQPIGVMAAITPWNFPIAMLARKIGAALAAGCTCVAKPAPETPLSALFFAKICDEAKLPAGVVNIITGDAVMIGERFMQSPIVRKVSFTGSTEVGKILIQQSAETVTKLSLELGGNAPCIITNDADLSKAIDGIILGKYRNAGQTCVCINRFLVHSSIRSDFEALLIERSKALVVGNGADANTDIGPLISDEAVNKVVDLVNSSVREGAQILLGAPTNTRFMAPIVVGGVTKEMRIWREEIFGPVCTITTFETDDEAIELANDTTYGLAAYVYSRDLSRALRMSERLDFGMVGINDTAISSVQAPFGGVKQSGYGREGSKYGVDDYLVLKYLSIEM